MKWQQVLVAMYRRLSDELLLVLDGMTLEEVKTRPAPGANPVGWLAWHITRSMDRFLGDIVLGEQLWVRDGWHERFRRPPDPHDTGMGHSDEQVDALYIPDVVTLVAYQKAVIEPLVNYLENLTEAELDRLHTSLLYPDGETRPVHTRLSLGDLEHLGQAAYARGLVKGHRWRGR